MKVLNRAQHYQEIWRDMIDDPEKTSPQFVMMPVTTTTHPRIEIRSHPASMEWTLSLAKGNQGYQLLAFTER